MGRRDRPRSSSGAGRPGLLRKACWPLRSWVRLFLAAAGWLEQWDLSGGFAEEFHRPGYEFIPFLAGFRLRDFLSGNPVAFQVLETAFGGGAEQAVDGRLRAAVRGWGVGLGGTEGRNAGRGCFGNRDGAVRADGAAPDYPALAPGKFRRLGGRRRRRKGSSLSRRACRPPSCWRMVRTGLPGGGGSPSIGII